MFGVVTMCHCMSLSAGQPPQNELTKMTHETAWNVARCGDNGLTLSHIDTLAAVTTPDDRKVSTLATRMGEWRGGEAPTVISTFLLTIFRPSC